MNTVALLDLEPMGSIGIRRFGCNSGDGVQGTFAGAKAMRQSIDRTGGVEYEAALGKWPLVSKV
jgi:hypothetical protein